MSLWKHHHASSQESFVWMKTIKNGQWVIDRGRTALGVQGCRITTENLLFTVHTFWLTKGLSQEKILTNLLSESNQTRNLGAH